MYKIPYKYFLRKPWYTTIQNILKWMPEKNKKIYKLYLARMHQIGQMWQLRHL